MGASETCVICRKDVECLRCERCDRPACDECSPPCQECGAILCLDCSEPCDEGRARRCKGEHTLAPPTDRYADHYRLTIEGPLVHLTVYDPRKHYPGMDFGPDFDWNSLDYDKVWADFDLGCSPDCCVIVAREVDVAALIAELDEHGYTVEVHRPTEAIVLVEDDGQVVFAPEAEGSRWIVARGWPAEVLRPHTNGLDRSGPARGLNHDLG